MTPEDIGALRQVEDPRVSPDGKLVAFVVADVDLQANQYRRRIWLASTDGELPPRPFSAGPNDQLPRWSPDGRWLAFSAQIVDRPCDLCVLPVGHGGERVVLASWPAPLTELAWSPSATCLAFVARDPDPERYSGTGAPRKAQDTPPRRLTRLFSQLDNEGWVVDRPNRVVVVAADGSAPPKALTEGPFEASGIAWSPDGVCVAFASARHDSWDLDGAVDLWTVPADGSGQPGRLTGTDAIYSSPAWSPDGSKLACLVHPTPLDEPRHDRLGVLELANGATTVLTASLDRNCGPYGSSRAPAWCGDRLLCSVEDAGNVHVYAVPASGIGAPERVVDGDLWVTAWDWAGGALALAVTTPTTFPELAVRKLSSSTVTGPDIQGPPEEHPRRLTDLTGPFAAKKVLAALTPFVARSADGTEVPCWAMTPVGAEPGRRYPTLLNVHGGPFTSYGNRFFDEFQMEVGGGFGVIFCNPRGSSGYEESWGRAVRWPECETDPGSGWGGVDFDDVMACVDEACRRLDWVDPDRLGIMGGSYGGYMTTWAICHTDRFKAACSERSCNNLVTLEHSSDMAGAFRGYVGRSHVEDPVAFARQSPATYVDRMTTPLLILHSEEDLRCPINQAEELFVALRLLGRDPVLVRFPGESHELSRSGAPRHRVERAQIVLDWFKQKLG
jgi:dipeptidyl aminopeptidase/acylaminoacyl peptidase